MVAILIIASYIFCIAFGYWLIISDRLKTKNMKKAISIILFLILVRVCDGQITIPTSNNTIVIPKATINRVVSSVQFSETWSGVDSLGNQVQYPGTWFGAQADSARLSALWRLTSLANQYNLPVTKAQIQYFITINGIK